VAQHQCFGFSSFSILDPSGHAQKTMAAYILLRSVNMQTDKNVALSFPWCSLFIPFLGLLVLSE